MFFLFTPVVFSASDPANREELLETYLRGDYQTAKKNLGVYLGTHPEDAEIHGVLGEIAMEEGDLPLAEEKYRKAVALQQTQARWRLALARVLAVRGDYAESEGLYREVLKSAPDHVGAQRGLIDVLGAEGKWNEALDLNEKLRGRLKDSWVEESAASDLLLKMEKLDEASRHLEKLIQLQPALIRPRVELCGIYLRQGNYEKCKDSILNFDVQKIQDVDFCMLRASYHMKKKDFEEANRWIQRAMELAPGQQGIVSLKYINDMQLGRIVLDEVRRRESGVKSSLQEHYRKAAMMMEGGNFLQAKSKIQWLMRYYPDDLELKLMLAVIEGEVGNFDVGIPALEAIIKTRTEKFSVIEMARETLKEFVGQKDFEQRSKAGPWESALKSETEYFEVTTNVGPPYRDQFLGELDGYVRGISVILGPLFDEPPKFQKKIPLRIYADKKSFVRDAYDYFFSDAVLFAGVYVPELDAIYYHFNKELKASGIIHEIGHAVLHHAGHNLPLWLDEGVADYAGMKFSGIDFIDKKLEGNHYMSQLFRFGNLPDLDVIVKTRDYLPMSYIFWRNAAEFMFEFGKGKYLPYLKKYIELVSNESFKADPFREAFAPVSEDLKKDWQTFAYQKFRL